VCQRPEQGYRAGVHDEPPDAVPCRHDTHSPQPPRSHPSPLWMMGRLGALAYDPVPTSPRPWRGLLRLTRLVISRPEPPDKELFSPRRPSLPWQAQPREG